MKIDIKKDVFSDLILMSSRYCIGKRTITTAHHAHNLVLLCDYLSQDERNQLMKDIQCNINNVLSWKDNVHCYGTNGDLFTSLCKLHSDNYEFIITNSNKVHYYVDFYNNKYEVKLGNEYINNWQADYIDLYSWHRLQHYLSKERYILEKNNIKYECFSVMCVYGNTYIEKFCSVSDYKNNPFVTKFINEYDNKYKI